jgi:hypothetical protein
MLLCLDAEVGTFLDQPWNQQTSKLSPEQRWYGVADHPREVTTPRNAVEGEPIRDRLQTGSFVRCECSSTAWMYVSALTHRPETAGDRLRGCIPPQPPIHRVVRVVAIAMAFWPVAVRKVVQILFEEQGDALPVFAAGSTRRIDERGFLDSV